MHLVPLSDASILLPVNAAPLLARVGGLLQDLHFDVVLIGNAAAALQGAPVTTVDLDFLFRKTPGNLRKLKALAAALGATVMRPYYPASQLYRVMRDDDGVQIDFMAQIHGVRSFERVRARAHLIEVAGVPLRVAALEDIIRSKRAAGRPRDRAVLEILERSLEESQARKRPSRRASARK
jgi:predicted nucleotidyltransferase